MESLIVDHVEKNDGMLLDSIEGGDKRFEESSRSGRAEFPRSLDPALNNPTKMHQDSTINRVQHSLVQK